MAFRVDLANALFLVYSHNRLSYTSNTQAEGVYMKIGLISDSHDRIPYIEKAVEIFNASNLDVVLHCGDFVSPFSLVPFQKLKAPLYAVFGNNDGERNGLATIFSNNGWILNDRPWHLELNGKKIQMLHEPAKLDSFIMNGEMDLIVFGHTHEKHFQKNNGVMVVNPGECCGWVKGTASISLINMDLGENVFVNL